MRETVITPQELSCAREWLCDCYWSNVDEEDIQVLPSLTIIGAVHRYFEGGLPAFLETCR